jgi:hypothetical protein
LTTGGGVLDNGFMVEWRNIDSALFGGAAGPTRYWLSSEGRFRADWPWETKYPKSPRPCLDGRVVRIGRWKLHRLVFPDLPALRWFRSVPARRVRWNQTLIGDVVAKIDAGRTLASVGEDYGVSRQRVWQLLQRARERGLDNGPRRGFNMVGKG